MKTRLNITALALVATLLSLASPAKADTITNIFYGTVVASSGANTTTTDKGKFFSNSISTVLVGDAFTFTLFFDMSKGYFLPDTGSNYSVLDGGADFGASNPISSTLQIGSLPKTGPAYDSSESVFYQAGKFPGEIFLDQYQYNHGKYGGTSINMDLQGIESATLSVDQQLPYMLASNGDFTAPDILFYDTVSKEKVVLRVNQVNSPSIAATPEPAGVLLLGTGLLGLGFVGYRRTANQIA